MVRTLNERLRIHEQRRARLAEAETKLKLDERKHRIRRLIEIGALAEKAGLLELNSAALYGAFLSLRDSATALPQVEHWATEGSRAFAREVQARDNDREPLLLVFDQPPAKAVATSLQKAGFRYSRVMRHWEGLARPEDGEALALAYGGRIQRLARINGVPLERTALETVP